MQSVVKREQLPNLFLASVWPRLGYIAINLTDFVFKPFQAVSDLLLQGVSKVKLQNVELGNLVAESSQFVQSSRFFYLAAEPPSYLRVHSVSDFPLVIKKLKLDFSRELFQILNFT